MSRRSKYDSSGGNLADSAQAQDISPGPQPGGTGPTYEFAGTGKSVEGPRAGTGTEIGEWKGPEYPVTGPYAGNEGKIKRQEDITQDFIESKGDYPGWFPVWAQVPLNINRIPNRKFFLNKVLKDRKKRENVPDYLRKDFDNIKQLQDMYDAYMEDRLAGEVDAYGRTLDLGNDTGFQQTQQAPQDYRNDPDYIAWLKSKGVTIDDEEEVEEDVSTGKAGTVYPYEFYGQPDYETSSTFESYLARGGRVPAAFGGIMDTETGRRGYFLGSIKKAVKGVAKAAGKVLRSPIGLAAAGYFLGGGGIGSFKGWGKKGFGKSPLAMSRFFQKNIAEKGMPFKPGGFDYLKAFTTLSPALAFTSLADAPKQETLSGAGGGGKLVDPLTNKEASPREMIASLNEAIDNADGDPDKIAAIKAAYRFLPPIQKLGQHGGVYPYEVKDGGRIGYAGGGGKTQLELPFGEPAYYIGKGENKVGIYRQKNGRLLAVPVGLDGLPNYAQGGRIRAQEGGLMDLGGMEKDYRNNGGFVAIGGEERADDVPARLSRNEFVFTADAVRGAGGGDIDKGAEIMENVMKNLEQGGKMSEESQGNAGAQEMFSVSERIGEVL